VLIADGRLNRYWTLVQYQNEIEMSKKISLRLTETKTADEKKEETASHMRNLCSIY